MCFGDLCGDRCSFLVLYGVILAAWRWGPDYTGAKGRGLKCDVMRYGDVEIIVRLMLDGYVDGASRRAGALWV